ncbi:MAG: hypothetical protein HQL56_19400 [Magnetococcales bacterium]|nr:hypothetical protein [Magnetococcales bacterium]
MIRIIKPAEPPEILVTKGQAGAKALQSQFDATPAGETPSFDFKENIYNAPEVKEALRAAQHRKCCFCESKIDNHPGDVEHFRPKAGYQQQDSDPLTKPGYYWLVYDWSNLYLACEDCNRSQKKNLFPLEDPGQRARNHHQDIAQEKPLLVDPGREDPEEAISWGKEMAAPMNRRGQCTVTTLALNERSHLVEQRLKHYEQLKLIHDLANGSLALRDEAAERALRDKAAEHLEEYQLPSGEFAAMVRAAVRNGFT